MATRFPHEAVLRDGRKVLIRPFAQHDARELYEFFQRLPLETRRFAWENIEDPVTVRMWADNLNYDQTLPLLAFDGTKVVAEAVLHRRTKGPLRLVGRVKWLIDENWRRVGLGTLLMSEFIRVSRERGLRHLTCMLISDLEKDAVDVLEHLGFKSVVFPEYGTDPDGNQHDMTKLILKL